MEAWFRKSALEKKIREILLDLDFELHAKQINPNIRIHEILTELSKRRKIAADLNEGYHWEGFLLLIVVTMLRRMVSNLFVDDYTTVEVMTAEFIVNHGGSASNMINDLTMVYRFR